MQPIANFEDKYDIFPDGRIFNKGNYEWCNPSQNSNGYLKLTLSRNGKSKQVSVHRLVALHYLPNPYQRDQVNHIDGNKLNNHVSNLEWVTPEKNINHALEVGLRSGYMSMDEKNLLLERVLNGELIRDLAIEVGRREETLSGMLRRAADKLNLREQWNDEMKRRRKNVAIRNLEKINH